MKKLISLLLAMALCVGILTGIALADDPAYTDPMECTQAEAAVKVTTAEDTSTVLYFPALSHDVIAWTCLNVAGEKTITLLKDLELTGAIEGTNYLLKIPNDLSSWAGRSGDKVPFHLDLNGNTLTYTGSANLFYVERFGFELENGTVIYRSDSTDNAAFAFSTPHFRTGYTNGTTVWTPDLVLKNVNIYNVSAQTAPVILNYQFAPVIKIQDSVVWSATGPVVDLQKTAQDKMGEGDLPYGGDYLPQIEIKDSTVGSAAAVPFSAVCAGTIMTVVDCVLVSGDKDGKLVNDDAMIELETKGFEAVEKADWTKGAPMGALKGKAYMYGDAAPSDVFPFEDVKETDWFFSFVKEAYQAGVVNGMTDTTFVPNGTLTYGQALKLIAVGMGWGEKTGEGHWAAGYLALAKAKGWLEGDVDLDGAISRLAFCKIAAKVAGLTETAENKFTDTDDASVLALVKAGVINGMTDTTFAPDATLTRAQIAKIITLLTKI